MTVSRIQFRRATASAWTSANPTLSAAELGYETDTGKFKIGNGSTAWTSLAYTHETPSDPHSIYLTSTEGNNTYVPLTAVGTTVASLSDGKIPSNQIPAIAITDTFVVASQSAMLALSAEIGDVAIRTDINKTFILSTSSPSTLADWKELLSPLDAVTSVDSRTGNVTLNDLYVSTSSLGTNVSTFLGTPSSANLASAVTDETGTGALVFGTSPTLSLPVIDNIKMGYSTTATAAGSTTLTSSSNHRQFFTGSTTQTIVLPVASTMVVGQSFEIHNVSTGNLTINSSGGNLVDTLEGGKSILITCILASGTTAASWEGIHIGGTVDTGNGSLVYGTGPTLSTPIIDNPALGYTSTATAAGTTTLVSTSSYRQYFTGTTTQTVVLPVASTMTVGQAFEIHNLSTGTVTVNSSGSNLVSSVSASTVVTIICILASGTSAASWDVVAAPTGSTSVTTLIKWGLV